MRLKLSSVSLIAAFCLASALPPLQAAENPEEFPGLADDVKRISSLLESAFDAYVDEDYERSIMNFQRVLQLNPKEKSAQRGLKQSQKMLQAKQEVVLQSERERIQQARKIIKREKWLDAMDIINSVLSASPNNREAVEIQNMLAADFRERMSDPNASPGNDLVYQGMIHYLNKRHEEAIKVWKQAAAVRPEEFKIVIYVERAEQALKEKDRYEVLVVGRSRAKAYFSSGNFEEAMKIWKKILEYTPDDAEARESLAKARTESLKNSRSSVIGDHYDKGLEFFNGGKFDESLSEWKSILEIDPENEVARDYVERIREKSAMTPSVTPTIDKPKAQQYYMQGAIKYADGNVEGAMKDWQQALRFDPNHAATLKVLKKISGGKN